MNKTLVAYYSLAGSTEFVAKNISEALNLDILCIKPFKELKDEGFSKFIWGGAQVLMRKTPNLRPTNIDLDEYDTILLGSPIWAGTYAPPIRSFLKDEKLVNKKIGYFYTHDGGADHAEEHAKEAINLHNTYAGAIGLEDVKNHKESSINLAVKWAKSII